MDLSNYTIIPMTRDDLDLAIHWAAAEGWNPGRHDADSFYAADPDGFFIGKLNGEPVSVISAIRYGDTFGFIGFYIVKPEYRGAGYGMQIWKAGMEYLKERNIGLDGVIEQQDNYKKSGFGFAYRNIRQQGSTDDILKSAQRSKDTDISLNDVQVIDLTDIAFSEIEKYDRQLFPANRTAFLKSWLQQPEKFALGAIKNGKLCGWGMVRPCGEGHKIGPLYADNPSMAESLFIELTSRIAPGSKIFLDTPETNPQAVALAGKYRMSPIFETARMYTKNAPKLPMEKYFGVTSFELG